MVEIVESVEEINDRRIALFDLEGTLMPGNRTVPEDAGPEQMEELLQGQELEGSSEVGYWSGIHLLAGEHPDDYFERVEEWKEGEVNVDEFENKNLELWNKMLEEKGFSGPKEFLDRYNEKFLNLRENSQELINICHERGLKAGIISHTSTSLSEEAAERLGVKYVIPSWEFNYEDNQFNRATMEKYAEDKSLLIPELREAGAEYVVFYGNAKNDVEIANKADESYMVENKTDLDYSEVKAFTGTFEQVLRRTRAKMEAKES